MVEEKTTDVTLREEELIPLRMDIGSRKQATDAHRQ